ncbi:hypothetical protein [Pseudomonas hormoni]
MKNTILLLTLLFSVNAFADHSTSKFVWSGKCLNSNCTRSEIEAENKANYQKHLQHIQDLDAEQEEEDREWSRQHDEDQARADALPKYQYKPIPETDNCVTRFYEKASSIIGDNAKEYIDVEEIKSGKCIFGFKLMAEEMCEYFDSFSSMATPDWSEAEWCRYRSELREVYIQYSGLVGTSAFTDAVQAERKAKLKPVEDKHHKIYQNLYEQHLKQLKQ